MRCISLGYCLPDGSDGVRLTLLLSLNQFQLVVLLIEETQQLLGAQRNVGK